MTTSSAFTEPRDSERAGASFELLLPTLQALSASEVQSPWVRQPEASRQAWALVERASEPARLQRLHQLAGEFDSGVIQLLHHAAWALFHTETKRSDASSTDSSALISSELYGEATALYQRLFRILEYNLGHIPEVAARLASIRSGRGYTDTASDLHRLAALCQEYHGILLHDANHYEASLPSRARELSATILQELSDSQTAETKRWTDLRARCFTVLARHYDDVRATCLWLHRHEPEQASQFPALSNAPTTKKPASSTKAASAAPDSADSAAQ